MKINNRVFLTQLIPQPVIDFLQSHIMQLSINSKGRPLLKSELKRALSNVEGTLCLLTDTIDKEVIDAAPRLKVIANYAVGYDNIDIEYATAKGIVVTNTPDVLTDATADLAVTLLFSASRRIVEADRFVREKKFTGWEPLLFLGSQINGKICGIVGAGRIGQAVAKRLKSFNAEITYTSRTRKKNFESALHAHFLSLDNLLKESDFISLHIPLTPETYHLISYREFSLMKKSAILVNTARGPIIDEKALVEALQNNKIQYAALDVFEKEPNIEEELYNLNNVILTPHIGSATKETRIEMGRIAAQNLIAVLEGKQPLHPV